MILKTSKSGKGRASHDHFVYVRQDRTGISTVDKDHSHQIDPTTLTLTFSNGHTHEILQSFEPEAKKRKLNKDEAVKEVRILYETAVEYEKDYHEMAKESEGFYDGTGQWANRRLNKSDREMKSALESKNRAALTINEIEPKIDLLSGYLRQNRTDFKFFPLEDGDSRVADILNIVVKNITEQNNYEYEETDVFEDGLIGGRGNIHTYIDYSKNMQGDIIIEQYAWDEVRYGPHSKKDISDCEYIVKEKWLSWAKIKQMWPEKADDIEKEIGIYRDTDEPHVTYADDQYKNGDNSIDVFLNPEYVDIAKKEYRVLELWRKDYRKEHVVINLDDDFFEAQSWSQSEVNRLKTIEGIKIVPRVKTRMEVIITAGQTLLDRRIDKYFDDVFPMIPFYVKKRKKKVWGKIEPAKDSQQEINKRHSQAVDILNKVAAYGWFYEDGTFPTSRDAEGFRANSSSPGFHTKVSDISRTPVQIEGVKFPSELVNMMAIDSQKVREIMNINLEMEGGSSNAQSGIAIVERKRQGLVGNEFVFDNLSLSKRLLGRILVKLIQSVYTPDRILRILENRSIREQIDIGGRQLVDQQQMNQAQMQQMQQQMQAEQQQQIQEQGAPQGQVQGPGQAGQPGKKPEEMILREEIIELLTNADLTKYDVAVGESAFNPTTRNANFLIWSEMAGKGLPIPPTMLVDLSDLPDKDKVKAEIEKTIQQQAQAEERKNQTEIQKTLIAKGNQGSAQ